MDRRQLDQLASSIASLYSGKYYDFSIRCADETIIRAHRAVVCPRSRVLAAAIDGRFEEAISKEIYLEDDEPSIVGKMMDFLYKLDYDDHRAAPFIPKIAVNPRPQATEASFDFVNNTALAQSQTQEQDQNVERDQYTNPFSLLVNTKVYIIADKYEIQALKDLAVSKYEHVLPQTWNSSAFTESALLVYKNTVETDRPLRDAIVQTASENIKILLDRGEFVDLLHSQGDLAVEVLRAVASSQVSPTEEEPILDLWGSSAKKKKGRRYALID